MEISRQEEELGIPRAMGDDDMMTWGDSGPSLFQL
jgi:hypothetical protein